MITTSESWSWDTLRRLLKSVSDECERRRLNELNDCESFTSWSFSISSAELKLNFNFLKYELKVASVTSAFVQSSKLLLIDWWHRLLKSTFRRSQISVMRMKTFKRWVFLISVCKYEDEIRKSKDEKVTMISCTIRLLYTRWLYSSILVCSRAASMSEVTEKSLSIIEFRSS